jgi:hypothetical protein
MSNPTNAKRRPTTKDRNARRKLITKKLLVANFTNRMSQGSTVKNPKDGSIGLATKEQNASTGARVLSITREAARARASDGPRGRLGRIGHKRRVMIEGGGGAGAGEGEGFQCATGGCRQGTGGAKGAHRSVPSMTHRIGPHPAMPLTLRKSRGRAEEKGSGRMNKARCSSRSEGKWTKFAKCWKECCATLRTSPNSCSVPSTKKIFPRRKSNSFANHCAGCIAKSPSLISQ